MIPKQVQEKLNSIAKQFGEKLMAQVKVVFAELSNSGELLQSLKLEIKPATDTSAPVISLSYEEQGFFLGVRRPEWVKQPPVDKLLNWGQNKSFTVVPGYKGEAPNLPDFKVRERVAWAIAKDKLKKNTWKPQLWKRKARVGALINELNNDTILKGYKEEYQQILVAAIEGR